MSVPGGTRLKSVTFPLAVSEKTGRKADYMKWLRIKGPQIPNLTTLITCDSSKSVGKKTKKSSTARRKGGRISDKAPPTKVVDRVPSVSTVDGPTTNRAQSACLPSHEQGSNVHPQQIPGQQPVPFNGFTCALNVAPPLDHQVHQLSIQLKNDGLSSMVYSIPTMPFTASLESVHLQLLQMCSSLVRTCFGCS